MRDIAADPNNKSAEAIVSADRAFNSMLRTTCEWYHVSRVPGSGGTASKAHSRALGLLLVGYSELAQARWVAWLRKQRLESTIPTEFSAVLDCVVAFVDPIIGRQISGGGNWHPQQRQWCDH